MGKTEGGSVDEAGALGCCGEAACGGEDAAVMSPSEMIGETTDSYTT